MANEASRQLVGFGVTGHMYIEYMIDANAIAWRTNHSSRVLSPGMYILLLYTSSPFLFTDYPLYFFCLQFTAQTVIFDNVARDRYLTKDFNNGLGSEVSPNWRSRNTDSSSKLYFDISTIYHALMWHNSSAFLLPVMTFQKEFRLVTLIFKFKFLTDPE